MEQEQAEVLRLIAEGVIPTLSEATLSEEIEGLHEDILNAECGHPIFEEERQVSTDEIIADVYERAISRSTSRGGNTR